VLRVKEVIRSIDSALRSVPVWLVYASGFVPALWLWYLGLTGGLGAEPIRALEQELGKVGLQFLLAALAISPIRRFVGLSLIRFRRAMGLLAFYYVLQHLAVWLVLDVGDPARIWADILKRPYITVGMIGFAAMLPLALTSTDRAVRRLGPERWRKLQRLSYVVVIAGISHYILLVKGWPPEPLLYAAVTTVLLALRLVSRRRAMPA
jgi:sulfoxide reductase heme-binding subunit YedZ